MRQDCHSDSEKPPALDGAFVRQVLGKRVLVGITHLKRSGEVIEQRQLHGVIETISPEEGVVIRLPDGAAFRLSPDLRELQPAAPGMYRLRSTGEEIENPDYLWTWTVTRPDA